MAMTSRRMSWSSQGGPAQADGGRFVPRRYPPAAAHADAASDSASRAPQEVRPPGQRSLPHATVCKTPKTQRRRAAGSLPRRAPAAVEVRQVHSRGRHDPAAGGSGRRPLPHGAARCTQRGPQAAEGRGWRLPAAGEPEPLVLERCMVSDPAQQWRWVDTQWGLNPHAALRWALRRRQRRTADAHACAHSSMAPAGQCIGRERLHGSDHHRLRFVPCPSSDGAPEGPRRCGVSRAAAASASPAAQGGCRH